MRTSGHVLEYCDRRTCVGHCTPFPLPLFDAPASAPLPLPLALDEAASLQVLEKPGIAAAIPHQPGVNILLIVCCYFLLDIGVRVL